MASVGYSHRVIWCRAWSGAVALAAVVGCANGDRQSADGDGTSSSGTVLGGSVTRAPATTATNDGPVDDPWDTMCEFGVCGNYPWECCRNFQGPLECDLFTQDCDVGEKCIPFPYSGSNLLDGTRCVPLRTTPKQIGDSCAFDGYGEDITDECEAGAMCWTDSSGELGCVPLCGGTSHEPACADGRSCVQTDDDSMALCYPSCDPLLQNCADGHGCYYWQSAFVCLWESGESLARDADCININDCLPGLFCADNPEDCETGYCCAQPCETDDPGANAECALLDPFYQCLAWNLGPPEFGVCGTPYSVMP